jgi:hypothetical protein
MMSLCRHKNSLSVDEFASELTNCLSVDEFASELTNCLSVDEQTTWRETFLNLNSPARLGGKHFSNKFARACRAAVHLLHNIPHQRYR